jgi:hypothetical protein
LVVEVVTDHIEGVGELFDYICEYKLVSKGVGRHLVEHGEGELVGRVSRGVGGLVKERDGEDKDEDENDESLGGHV